MSTFQLLKSDRWNCNVYGGCSKVRVAELHATFRGSGLALVAWWVRGPGVAWWPGGLVALVAWQPDGPPTMSWFPNNVARNSHAPI